MSDHLRMRKFLDTPPPAAAWPLSIAPVAFESVDPHLPHELLQLAFPGLVAPFADWYANLTQDTEYDPALCVPAMAPDGSMVGFVQCWTSNFVKDLAVAPAHRGKGVGAALMQHVFGLFAERGAPYVDLKVQEDEQPARRLYARLGMVQAPL